MRSGLWQVDYGEWIMRSGLRGGDFEKCPMLTGVEILARGVKCFNHEKSPKAIWVCNSSAFELQITRHTRFLSSHSNYNVKVDH